MFFTRPYLINKYIIPEFDGNFNPENYGQGRWLFQCRIGAEAQQ
jgi:hypothetical protein